MEIDHALRYTEADCSGKKIVLPSYLQQYEPQELKRTSPHEYCTVTHDSLEIGNDKWHWFSQNIYLPENTRASKQSDLIIPHKQLKTGLMACLLLNINRFIFIYYFLSFKFVY